MLHLFLSGTEVDSCSHTNPSTEYDLAYADAQQWANDYGEAVEIWDYEDHETVADGERVAIVYPQPLQLALMDGADEVIEEVTP
jgi:hypothetical protein